MAAGQTVAARVGSHGTTMREYGSFAGKVGGAQSPVAIIMQAMDQYRGGVMLLLMAFL